MEKQNNRPQLRFPEFNNDWELKKLGELTDLVTKGTTPKKFVDKGIKFIKIECFDGDRIIPEKCLFIDDKTHNKELKRSILRENDLLFAIAGATIGKVNFVNKEILPANTNQALSIIRLKKDENRKFVYQNLKSERMRKYINDSISVGAQPNLNLQQINNFSFYYPSKPEQQKISDFLEKIDTYAQAVKKEKDLLEKYKKGVVQKFFSQEIRFKDKNGAFFPDWTDRKLGDVLHEHKLKSTGIEEVFSVSVHKGLINQIEHLGRSFSASNTDHYNLVQPNDIVYTKSPTGDFPLGIIKQSKIDKNVIVSPLYGIFTPESKGLGYLLNVHFESPINTANYLGSLIQKGAKNTINITNSTFLSKEMKLPTSIDEQNKIGDFLEAIDKKITELGAQIDKVETWKKGLLQKMFC